LRPFIWSSDESASNDPGTVKITIRKFYRISGASTQLKGVTPDIVLPDELNALTDIGESSLPDAMPWDTIRKADCTPLNLVEPYRSELRKLSDARVATNQDFIYIRQDIDEFKKLQAEKTVSLNEQEELDQAEKNALRQKARDAERAQRKAPDEKIYEITLEDVNKRGLPPLLWPTNMTATPTNTTTTRSGMVNPSHLPETLSTMPAAVPGAISLNGPPPDPLLDETEHILEDYVSLMKTNELRPMIASHSDEPADDKNYVPDVQKTR
jgi:hypothetical protein